MSGLPTVDGRLGGSDTTAATRPTSTRRPRAGTSNGAIEQLRQEMTIDAGGVPVVADIETRLKGTKNAVFAKHAFGVPR